MSQSLPTFDEAADAIAHFQFLAYRLFLTATTPMRLPPYKGSAFRGGFGHALKQSVCHTPTTVCDTCRMPEHCPYPYLFETTIALHTADTVQQRSWRALASLRDFYRTPYRQELARTLQSF